MRSPQPPGVDDARISRARTWWRVIRPERRNSSLGRIVAPYAIASATECAMWLAAIVYAFDHGGPRMAGFASIGLYVPGALAAPYIGRVADGGRPNAAFVTSLATMSFGLTLATLLAWRAAPAIAVVAGVGLASATTSLLRPASVVVIPGHVRSARELTLANLHLALADNVSALAGPLLASAMLAAGGATAVFLASAVATAFGAIIAAPLALRERPLGGVRPVAGTRERFSRQWRIMRSRRSMLTIVTVITSQNLLIGSIDLCFVVMAQHRLHLSHSGPALLGALFGAGALLNGIAARRLVLRDRLAPLVIAALVTMAGTAALLGVHIAMWSAVLTLPLLGFGRALLDVSARMLLQRSCPPHAVASVFATLEVLELAAMAAGALITQAVIAASGVDAALLVFGVFFALLLALGLRALRHADAEADVPVVATALLRSLPVFAPLSPEALDIVARAAAERDVEPGTVVIRQGDHGDRYYAVLDGEMEVSVDGQPVRRLTRGTSFGDVALLADVPRTATVTALSTARLLELDRRSFLDAVTGHRGALSVAWGELRTLHFGADVSLDALRGPADEAPVSVVPPS